MKLQEQNSLAHETLRRPRSCEGCPCWIGVDIVDGGADSGHEFRNRSKQMYLAGHEMTGHLIDRFDPTEHESRCCEKEMQIKGVMIIVIGTATNDIWPRSGL